MTFRLRPSSKKSIQSQNSLVQFPKPQHTFISNQVMNIKQLTNKLQMLQNNFNIINQNIKRDRQISNAGYIQIQKRLDLLQYKSFTNQKDIQQLSDINKNTFSLLPPLKHQQNHSLGKNQISILKQTLLQQKQSQKQQIKHISSIIQQISYKQLKIEQQLRQSFNKTRQQYQSRLSTQTTQIQKIDQYKMKKIDQQYQLMKQSMAQIQRRIYDQLQNKIRKQTIIKDFISQKIHQVKQQILIEQKQLISTQTKLTRQTKQSLQSLYSILNNIKSTFTQQLSQTQQLSINNIKRLSMNLDILNQKISQKFKALEVELKDNQNQVIQFRQWVVNKIDQNRQIIMGLEENAVQQIQNNQRGIYQNNQENSSPHLNQKFITLQKQFNSWKTLIEQKNLTIFKEISQSIKQIKIDYKKQNDQLSSELISLTQSMRTIKKSIPIDMKKISQTIITIFNDQFDVLAQELDLLTQMIKLSKQQGQKFTKQQIKKHKQQFLQQIKALIQNSKKQQNLLLQKSLIKSQESQKSSLQKQSTYIQSLFNQKLQALQSQIKQIQSQSKKLNISTNSQIQSFTLSMKQFNQNYKQYLEEQRKQDLKKRIQLEDSMRKNASNLMELAYKKSQFLVEGMKNAIEMNFMKDKLENKQEIQTVRDQLNRTTQHHKQDLLNSMKTLSEKLTNQRQSSEIHLEEQFKQNLNNIKKNLTQQIGNNKQELQAKLSKNQKQILEELKKNQQKISQITSKVQQIKKNVDQQILKLKKNQQQLQILTIIKKLQLQMNKNNSKMNNDIQQLNQKIKEIQQLNQKTVAIQEINKKINKIQQDIQKQKKQQEQKSQAKLQALQVQMKKQIQKQVQQVSQKQQDTLKQIQETLNTLRQTVWKLQAMNFSEQAKNKALFDRMNEDMNNVMLNIEIIGKQINTELKKRQIKT